MFIYPLIANLLELNESQKASVVKVTESLVGGIVKRNLTLVDPATGNRTR
jgi:hypothetical protein